MTEKFYITISDREKLRSLNYNEMRIFLLSIIKNFENYRLLELVEKYYGISDHSHGLYIHVDGWVFEITDDIVTNGWYLNLKDIKITLYGLYLPTDRYKEDKKRVLKFIDSIPIHPE